MPCATSSIPGVEGSHIWFTVAAWDDVEDRYPAGWTGRWRASVGRRLGGLARREAWAIELSGMIVSILLRRAPRCEDELRPERRFPASSFPSIVITLCIALQIHAATSPLTHIGPAVARP